MYTVTCITEIIQNKVYTHLKHLLLSEPDETRTASSVYTDKNTSTFVNIYTLETIRVSDAHTALVCVPKYKNLLYMHI